MTVFAFILFLNLDFSHKKGLIEHNLPQIYRKNRANAKFIRYCVPVTHVSHFNTYHRHHMWDQK